MTTKQKNPIIAFFASVHLALVLLLILAVTSIIGTIIPQNSPSGLYVERYGPQFARFIELLNFSDMYNSWWFLLLLLLFAINLTVCSLERIPRVINLLKRDNLETSVERLLKMSFSTTIEPKKETPLSGKIATDLLQQLGWKTDSRDKEHGTLLFAQKGGWTRFGVYIVHISILVILIGAVIGSSGFAKKILNNRSFAFKGSVMLPETRQTSVIYPFKGGEPIDLGFSVRCNYFTIEYYDNGMPKTYLSEVSVLEGNQVVQTKNIEVNTPLKYKGITFYQSSYQPYQDFVVSLENKKEKKSTQVIIPPAEQEVWEEGQVSFGVINKEARGEATRRVKIWFDDEHAEPSVFWVNMGQEAVIERPNATYHMQVKQLYATGLQVTKDPGVFLVYSGCILMLIGLYIAFFMSHQKVFIFIPMANNKAPAILAGTANKNKQGFEKKYTAILEKLTQ